MRTRLLLLCLLIPATAALAEERPQKAFNQKAYQFLKEVVLRSAERMPEESYAFKPVDTVRTFGQLIGHVADSQYAICSIALGEKNPSPKVEKTKSSKAELIAALKESFSYCDRALDAVTPANAGDMLKFHGQDMTRLDVLTANNMHTVEHYGNIITYLRIKGLVPPSTEMLRQQAAK